MHTATGRLLAGDRLEHLFEHLLTLSELTQPPFTGRMHKYAWASGCVDKPGAEWQYQVRYPLVNVQGQEEGMLELWWTYWPGAPRDDEIMAISDVVVFMQGMAEPSRRKLATITYTAVDGLEIEGEDEIGPEVIVAILSFLFMCAKPDGWLAQQCAELRELCALPPITEAQVFANLCRAETRGF